ncbi:MAG: C25 family peptidase propeptide domain-containing protein [Candidatus Erginobacter occultus]|nr:C25 family peptidase propeptide domain-containing protein [Candidatus Erginobacter occultus]
MNIRTTASGVILGILFFCAFVHLEIGTAGAEEEIIGETIQREYNFAEPVAADIKVFENPFQRIKIPGLTNYWKEGEPLLPVEVARILLPYGREAGEVTVIPGEKFMLEGNYGIEPGQRPVPFDQEFQAEYVPPKLEIYDSLKPFPEGRMLQVQTVITRGYRILIVSLSPISYIPKTGKIEYCRELTLAVEVVPESKPPRTFRGLAGDAELVRKNIDNPEVLSTYPLR